MKILFMLIAGVLCCQLQVMSQSHKQNDYKQLPKLYRDRDSLVRFVVPDKNYTYWQFVEGGMDTTREGHVIFCKGKKPDSIQFKDPKGSFLMDCLPGFCYKYIAYVYNGKVGYITSDEQFIEFMGDIDDLQEAVLLAEIKTGYYPDERKRGGEYLKSKGLYEVILTKEMLCPNTKEAIRFTIGSKGIIKKVSNGVYFKSIACIVI
jgi:hypothetical protein